MENISHKEFLQFIDDGLNEAECLSYKEFLQFLASDLNEAEYFGCDKSSLITLKDYLNEVQQKHIEFQKQIKEPLDSIKRKNRWVDTALPFAWNMLQKTEGIDFSSKRGNGPNICAIKSPYPEKGYVQVGGWRLPMIALIFHLQVKNRRKILDNSQKEIEEIDKIARDLQFSFEKFDTVSGIFSIVNEPQYDIRMYWSNDWLNEFKSRNTINININPITSQLGDLKTLCEKEEFYQKEGIYLRNLTSDEKEKLVKKLCIKR